MNFSLEQNVDILSAYHVERFIQLRDNEQYQDADSIAQEYICNGEVEHLSLIHISEPTRP